MRKLINRLFVLTFLSCLQVNGQTGARVITLEQCIDYALDYNPSIKEAANEFNLAALGVKSSESALYPVISTEFSGGFSSEYRSDRNYKTGKVALSADQVLWQRGRINADIEQTSRLARSQSFALDARKLDIIVSVKTAYLNCLLQEQLYIIATDNVSKANLFLEYAQELYKIGTGRKSEVLKAESDLSAAQFDKDVYLNSIKRAKNELCMLTGLSPERFSELEDCHKYNRPDAFEEQIDTSLSKAYRNYPELQIVKNQELAQEARIHMAKAELFPRLGLNFGYNWIYNPVYQDQKGWFTLLTLRWKLYNGNAQRIQIRSETIRKAIYESREDAINDFLQNEINTRIINIREAISQIRLSDRMIITTSENLAIAMTQYKVGSGSLLELTDARIADLNTRQKNIIAITAYQIALVNLERLTGKY